MNEGAAEKEKDHGPRGLGAAAEGGGENFVMVTKTEVVTKIAMVTKTRW